MTSPQILQLKREGMQKGPASEPFGESLSLPLALLALGFIVRLVEAGYRFLNADEALHYLLSVQPSLAAAYRASLTTAHPPLLIVFLHYWGMMGRSELFLRFPSLLAGVVFSWIMFCWLKRVTDHTTALIALVLFLFSPALVFLTTEVRQYGLLLLFAASSLYFLDRAIEEDSPGMALLSSVASYLALLTHYSSLIFALTLGVYALVRFFTTRVRGGIFFTWVAGQLGALALVAFLFVHHVSKLRASGVPDAIAATYLRRSVFYPGQDTVLSFVSRSHLRLFHYLFSQGAVGALGLALFVCGLFLLIRGGNRSSAARVPSSWQVALLLSFPLLINCGVALFRLYPYGGTRHSSYLAIFVIPGIAFALARWKPAWLGWKLLALGVVLAICNLFPSPRGEYIRARDQHRTLMTEAVAALNSLPPDSTIFTDDQGGLLLSYYLCRSNVVQIEQQPFQPFLRARCGPYWVISLDPDVWIFKADTFPDTMRSVQQTYNLSSGTTLWLFQAGWLIDRELPLREELTQFGCPSPRDFGRSIFLCPVTLNGR